MTQNRAAADDLLQEVAAKALAANKGFEAGTNFGAWMHRIMVNSSPESGANEIRWHGIKAGFPDHT
jgi:hypothetical protein